MSRGPGEIQQKVMLLLLGGLALGLNGSPRRHFQITKTLGQEWKKINNRALKRAIRSLYQSKLIGQKANKDGSVSIVLTKKGINKTVTFNLDNLQIKKMPAWDKKWRIILFDIPENEKMARDAFRTQLKNLGFFEFQKSVFVHCYNCEDEIDYLIEFYNIRKFVRFILADFIDTELQLRQYFGL
jgi:DNA-binding transcriptional regulator PaaX